MFLFFAISFLSEILFLETVHSVFTESQNWWSRENYDTWKQAAELYSKLSLGFRVLWKHVEATTKVQFVFATNHTQKHWYLNEIYAGENGAGNNQIDKCSDLPTTDNLADTHTKRMTSYKQSNITNLLALKMECLIEFYLSRLWNLAIGQFEFSIHFLAFKSAVDFFLFLFYWLEQGEP